MVRTAKKKKQKLSSKSVLKRLKVVQREIGVAIKAIDRLAKK